MTTQAHSRSTKAGAEAPARGLGPGPRTPEELLRSTKAGAEAPARELDRPTGVACVLPRSTKAGAEAPARDRPVPGVGGARPRSTKAGAEAPARGPPQRVTRLASVAQRRPGPKPRRVRIAVCTAPADAFAQRRPGPKPRRVRAATCGSSTARSALNEGRGRSPGAWSIDHADWKLPGIAQRRPGPKPRRVVAWPVSWRRSRAAQRRPGPKPRRVRARAARADSRQVRSTKAGAEAPARALWPPYVVGHDRPASRRGKRAPSRSPNVVNAVLLPRIIGGSGPDHRIQGCPSSRNTGTPREVRASASRPSKR